MLYDEALKIVESSTSFQVKYDVVNGSKVAMFGYRLADFNDFYDNNAFEMRGLTYVQDILGGSGSRESSFIFERDNTHFHSNIYPSAVWKNGSSITSSNFNLSVINQYMILRVVVNDNNLGPHSNWKLGDDGTGWSLDMDLAEVVCFSSQLSASDAQKVEGYLAHKWGLETNLPGSLLTSVVEKNVSDVITLTKTLTYDGDGNLASITKDYA